MGSETEEKAQESFEETRASLLSSLERAHELICEARQVIGAKEKAEPKPPSPAR